MVNYLPIGIIAILLRSMFAQFTVKSKGKKKKSLGLSALYFTINMGKAYHKINLEELQKIVIEKRKKLAPLIAGGIITSLSLLSMVLYSSSFEIIGLIAFGLLLIYIGIMETCALNTSLCCVAPVSIYSKHNFTEIIGFQAFQIINV